MRITTTILLAMITLIPFAAGCDETPAEQEQKIENAADATGDALQRGAEKTGEALNKVAESTGQVISDVAQKTPRVDVDVDVTTRPTATQPARITTRPTSP